MRPTTEAQKKFLSQANRSAESFSEAAQIITEITAQPMKTTQSPATHAPTRTFHIQKMKAPVEYGKPYRLIEATGEVEFGIPRLIYRGSYENLRDAKQARAALSAAQS